MKVKHKGNKESFQPFELVLTVETEEDAKALYAIFNYAPNTELFEDCISNIRNTIGHEYGNLSGDDVIANGITYNNFYRSKN